MEALLNKLENYIFDIVGLFIPGATFLFLISRLFELQTLTLKQFEIFMPQNYSIYIFIVASYLWGHAIKVSATWVYKMGGKSCDSFKMIDYDPKSEDLEVLVVDELNKRLGITVFKSSKWFLTFKFSEIILKNTDTKTVKELFLAKYNLYRSLAFLFTFLLTTSIIVKTKMLPSLKLSAIADLNYWYILIALIILIVTFHIKYRRYWMLCGNETLIGLYYCLNKKNLAL